MDLSQLNMPQREAVECTEGPLLILAGAGSGKTRVLTTRIAYLIYEKQVAPWNILANTFTNKAAQEMRERIVALVGQAGEKVWASTFHSTCVRILRNEINYIGYDTNFVIYDESDQLTLLKMILKEMNLDEKKFPAKGAAARISAHKNELLDSVRLCLFCGLNGKVRIYRIVKLFLFRTDLSVGIQRSAANCAPLPTVAGE